MSNQSIQVGSRVKYVGNSIGHAQRTDYVGKKGTVTALSDPSPDMTAFVKWDGSEYGRRRRPEAHYLLNLRVIDATPAPSKDAVIRRYADKFDNIVKSGTVVPTYTALGFLTEFLREIEEVD